MCAFANPLEIDNHNKTEAGAILGMKFYYKVGLVWIPDFRIQLGSVRPNIHIFFTKKKTNVLFYFSIYIKAQIFFSEGKYWKRKLATVTAEYKRWRIFYKQQHETCVTTTTAHHQLAGDHFMDATNTLYQYGTKVTHLLLLLFVYEVLDGLYYRIENILEYTLQNVFFFHTIKYNIISLK